MVTLAILGVDPGTRGGVAVVASPGRGLSSTVPYLRGFKPSMTTGQVANILNEAVAALEYHGGRTAFLEKVGYIPGDGGLGSFTFGRVAGFLEGYLCAKRLDLRYVAPTSWQSRLGCLTGGNKNVTKDLAKRMFPSHDAREITHTTADALLIAEYGRQVVSISVQNQMPTIL